uniref:CAP domain-containing protein (inferred by orthology to a human protein) n=1 Tax=Strongyloides venezuelensis TaxID=75913 RepID=A0A0K0FJA1_STRVS
MNNLIFSAFLISTLIGVSCLSYAQSHGAPDSKTFGFDISSVKGNNEFSNKIFDKIWEGFNYESDSKSGFKDMKDRILKESNEYRAAHDAKPLTVDSAIAQKAQAYAEHLAKIGKMQHDPTNQKNKLGENLAFASPRIAHIGVKGWYDEVKDYNFKKQGFRHGIGHFTQLVWKSSSKVGCGVAAGSKGVFTVCKYSPAGNLMGAFEKNVSPKKA